MQLKPTVIYIIHDEDEYQRNTINQLSLSLGYDAVVIQCVSQLFVSLADPNQAVDAIIFDIHDLYCMQKTSAFDILSTTATLISCKYRRVQLFSRCALNCRCCTGYHTS